MANENSITQQILADLTSSQNLGQEKLELSFMDMTTSLEDAIRSSDESSSIVLIKNLQEIGALQNKEARALKGAVVELSRQGTDTRLVKFLKESKSGLEKGTVQGTRNVGVSDVLNTVSTDAASGSVELNNQQAVLGQVVSSLTAPMMANQTTATVGDNGSFGQKKFVGDLADAVTEPMEDEEGALVRTADAAEASLTLGQARDKAAAYAQSGVAKVAPDMFKVGMGMFGPLGLVADELFGVSDKLADMASDFVGGVLAPSEKPEVAEEAQEGATKLITEQETPTQDLVMAPTPGVALNAPVAPKQIEAYDATVQATGYSEETAQATQSLEEMAGSQGSLFTHDIHAEKYLSGMSAKLANLSSEGGGYDSSVVEEQLNFLLEESMMTNEHLEQLAAGSQPAKGGGIKGAIGGVRDRVAGVMGRVGGMATSAKDAVGGFVGKGVDKVKGVFARKPKGEDTGTKPKEGVGFLDKMKESFSGMFAGIGSFFGGSDEEALVLLTETADGGFIDIGSKLDAMTEVIRMGFRVLHLDMRDQVGEKLTELNMNLKGETDETTSAVTGLEKQQFALADDVADAEASSDEALLEAVEEGGEGDGLLGSLFEGGMMGVVSKIGAFLAPVGALLSTAFAAIMPVIASVGAALLPIIAIAGALFVGYKIGKWLNEKFDIGGKIADGITAIGGKFGEMKDFASAKIGEFVGAIKEKVAVVTDFVGGIVGKVGEFFSSIKDSVLNFFQPVIDVVTGVVTKVKETLQPVIDVVSGIFNKVLDTLGPVGDVIRGIIDTVGGYITAFFEGGPIGLIKHHIETMGNLISNVIEKVGGIFKKVTDGIMSFFEPISNVIKKLMDIAGPLLNPAGFIGEKIGSFFGFGSDEEDEKKESKPPAKEGKKSKSTSGSWDADWWEEERAHTEFLTKKFLTKKSEEDGTVAKAPTEDVGAFLGEEKEKPPTKLEKPVDASTDSDLQWRIEDHIMRLKHWDAMLTGETEPLLRVHYSENIAREAKWLQAKGVDPDVILSKQRKLAEAKNAVFATPQAQEAPVQQAPVQVVSATEASLPKAPQSQPARQQAHNKTVTSIIEAMAGTKQGASTPPAVSTARSSSSTSREPVTQGWDAGILVVATGLLG